MAVIPFVVEGEAKTVVETAEAFAAARGLEGRVILIQGLDKTQLSWNEANVTYDLRVGQEYRDHRDAYKHTLPEDEEITLPPGAAVIIETEERLHLPISMFGYIIPKVSLLQKGITNTSSKVDPGYDGHLLITVFNLGKKAVKLRRFERFCALCLLRVADGATLYRKGEKRIEAITERRFWPSLRDNLERNTAAWMVIVTIVSVGSIIINIVLALWRK
jgi:deoxycytidine triphosphate deaminase